MNVGYSGAGIGTGDVTGLNIVRARFWTPIGGTGTAPASITKGMVCVRDFFQRGAYNNGTTTRTVSNSTPNYSGVGGDGSADGNVTVINDDTTTALARVCRQGPFFILLDDTLANGAEGNFAVGGVVTAKVLGTVSLYDRLSIDTTNNTNAGALKRAAANDMIVGILRSTPASNLALVEMVPFAYQTVTTGVL